MTSYKKGGLRSYSQGSPSQEVMGVVDSLQTGPRIFEELLTYDLYTQKWITVIGQASWEK